MITKAQADELRMLHETVIDETLYYEQATGLYVSSALKSLRQARTAFTSRLAELTEPK